MRRKPGRSFCAVMAERGCLQMRRPLLVCWYRQCEGGDMTINLKTVEELIKEIELADPIDWGMLRIDEEDATRLIASSVVEHYEENIKPMTEIDREYVVISSIAKLTLENFVLNIKLAQATGTGG
jgi:hypothetical protein